MPSLSRWARWLAIGGGLLLALGSIPARAASPYGLLDHYEVCDPSLSPGDPYHDYSYLRSIAVDSASNIYLADSTGVIRVLTAGGIPLGTLDRGPRREWDSAVVANGPAGVVYIGDQGSGTDMAQLAKYTLSNGNLVLAQTYNPPDGQLGATNGIRYVGALAATANRGLFILDNPDGGIFNVNDQTGAFISVTPTGGHGIPTAMTAIPNAIVTASTNDDGTPDYTEYYTGAPLSYSGELGIGPWVTGVADGYDGSIWVLDGNGLEHYRYGTLVDSVPVHGQALDTSPDGSIWITRDDGILHIGHGGSTIPPDQYGHAPCGGPQISDSLPHQSIVASHQLEVDARCADPCGLVSAATLTVPGSSTIYHLVAPSAAYSANGTFDLRLAFKTPAYRALVNAVRRHRAGTVLLNIGAIDAGAVRAYFQQRITIARLTR